MFNQTFFTLLAVVVVLVMLYLVGLWLHSKGMTKPPQGKQPETDLYDIELENIRNYKGDNTR